MNHNQLEELKARSYCWPMLHQSHFLIAAFNLLIGLQQCSQTQGKGYAAEGTWMAQKKLGKEPRLEKPQHLHQHSGQPSPLTHPPLETGGYCSA